MRLGGLGFVVLCGVGALCFAGCGGDDDSKKSGSGGSGGAGGAVNSECKPTADTCYVAGPTGPGNACLGKADFSAADVTMLRMTSHQIESPTALAAPFVQDAIITKKSALYEPECNLDGLGEFNFLMQVDTAKKELTLGGGVPQKLVGAATEGTCWAVFTEPVSKLDVKTVTVPYTESGGTLSAKLQSFVMPIFLEDKLDLAKPGDSVVLVPLHEMDFTAELSSDKNCIGRYAPERLQKASSCQPNEGEFAWDKGGTYQGYITVEEADDVMVVSLGKSLCVVLTGDPKKWEGKTTHDCATSPGFTETGALPKGDWCSTTNSAGGCQDSWKLVIHFAAQAINIKGEYDPAKSGC